METAEERDRRIIEAARALLYDTSTVLHDLQRRSPKRFAARIRMLVNECEDIARELETWEDIPARYADPPPSTPPDR